MMNPIQFNALKREIAARMLDEMPDEALGELIDDMREMLAHFGTRTAQQHEQAQAPTLANRDELAALRKQREAAARVIEMDTQPLKPSPPPEPETKREAEIAAKHAARKANTAAAAAHAQRIAELKAARAKARQMRDDEQTPAASSDASSDASVDAEKPHSITTRTSLLSRLDEIYRAKKEANQGQ